MTEYRTTCKDCGEYLEGDGFKRVIHCPNIEELGCYEPDAGPIYCGEGVGLNELLAVNARLGDSGMLNMKYCRTENVIAALREWEYDPGSDEHLHHEMYELCSRIAAAKWT